MIESPVANPRELRLTRELEPAHQFDDIHQQYDAGTMGMWIFLATEILFFGGLFLAYIVYRMIYPEPFAVASKDLDVMLGTINTVVLLSSSFTMATAVYASQTRRRRLLIGGLAGTLLLGLVFIAIKLYEYYEKYTAHHVPGPSFDFPAPYTRAAEMYFTLYYAMTGLHAVHMIVGCGLLGVLLWLAWRNRLERHIHIELPGLYWHFVDIIWIFLYPLLYLIGRHLK